MEHNDWRPEDRAELWEQSAYRTGSTCPPKSRRGVLAALLVAAIFLCGIATVFGLLNIRLFHNARQAETENAAFRFSGKQEASAQPQQENPDVSQPGRKAQIQLQQAPAGIANVPQQGGLSLQQIYSQTIDSVVSVTCTTDTGISTGTGVVVSESGYLVTNSHVIEGARQLRVLLSDGSTLDAQVIGTDKMSDLAVLYVETAGLCAAVFGDDSALRVGDIVVAIGDPLGTQLRGTMTDGIVSAINRNISVGGRTMTLIQTNAALNEGNSGGPLINCYGQVIGINTMKIGDNVSDSGVEGVGFAIPSTTVKEVVDQLIEKGYVPGRPSMGIAVQALSAFDQMYYRLPPGLYITQVEQGTDAEAKGLLPGDILTSLNGQRLTNVEMLQRLLYSYAAGDTVTAGIFRDGAQYQLQLQLNEAK